MVYLCMMMADWMQVRSLSPLLLGCFFRLTPDALCSLQGPYVYALYESYGFSIAQIGRLFIVGFGCVVAVGV